MKIEKRANSTMHLILWIAQGILAAGFIWAASMKLFQSAAKLSEMWPWAGDHPQLVKITGVLDLLAGIGLILPSALRIQPKLTVLAAYGTIALMISASIFHIVRGEASQIGINVFFALVAGFVVWGRQRKA